MIQKTGTLVGDLPGSLLGASRETPKFADSMVPQKVGNSVAGNAATRVFTRLTGSDQAAEFVLFGGALAREAGRISLEIF